MALESLDNRINITELSIDNPPQERLGFDPSYDFDKTEIRDYLQSSLSKSLIEFHPVGVAVKILFPDKHKQLLQLNESAWKKSQEYWEFFLNDNAQLKIIKAQRVEITEQEFKLVMGGSKKEASTAEPVPQQRNF